MKENLRKKFLAIRNRISREDVDKKSGMISEKLFSLPEYLEAGTVMFYVSFQSEVRTDGMIREALKEKRVVVPAVRGKDLAVFELKDYDNSLERGSFGILEPREGRCMPVETRTINLVIVPGVVFDKYGGRLGFGRGYYDRFLRGLKKAGKNVRVIGLAFSEQVVEKLELDSNDIEMDRVVTERAVYGRDITLLDNREE